MFVTHSLIAHIVHLSLSASSSFSLKFKGCHFIPQKKERKERRGASERERERDENRNEWRAEHGA
jgi:hypothetical protein